MTVFPVTAVDNKQALFVPTVCPAGPIHPGMGAVPLAHVQYPLRGVLGRESKGADPRIWSEARCGGAF